MNKSLERRNILTIYVRKKYLPIFVEFEKLINEDDSFKNLRYRKRKTLLSVAIMQLIYRYVQERSILLNKELSIQNDTS